MTVAAAPDRQLVLVLDDDIMITDGLAAALEREGRTLITCNDVESAEMIVERFRPSHVVTDIRISGPFGYEGLDFIRYVRLHAPESRVILMSGDAPEALQLEGSERGAVAFLQKPFEVVDLDNILNLIACSPLSGANLEERHIRVPMLEEIIKSTHLRPFFQPIVALDGAATVIGYESLARYRNDSPMRNPDVLFEYARKKDRVPELELACVASTFVHANAISSTASLFLNIHPHAFRRGPALAEFIVSHATRHDVALDRVVLEITEQASLPDTPIVFDSIEELRATGVRFALDDVGIAYSHLPMIGRLRPSFLKVSQHFGTRFEQDGAKTKIVGNIASLARDFNSEVIIEGVEDQSTAVAAAQLGIRYAQGFLFGRPAEPDAYHR